MNGVRVCVFVSVVAAAAVAVCRHATLLSCAKIGELTHHFAYVGCTHTHTAAAAADRPTYILCIHTRRWIYTTQSPQSIYSFEYIVARSTFRWMRLK